MSVFGWGGFLTRMPGARDATPGRDIWQMPTPRDHLEQPARCVGSNTFLRHHLGLKMDLSQSGHCMQNHSRFVSVP